MAPVQYFMKIDECMNFMFPLDKLPIFDENALSSILDEQNVSIQRLIEYKELLPSQHLVIKCFKIKFDCQEPCIISRVGRERIVALRFKMCSGLK